MSASLPPALPRGGPLRPRPASAYLFLAIVMLAWAGNSIVGRAIRADVPPFTLALIRWSGAIVLVAPFALPALRRDAATLGAHWRLVAGLGLLGAAAFNAFLYLALHHTTATNAILIQAAIPPFILVANFLLFREAAASLQILGVGLSTLGVALVVSRADPQVLLGLQFNGGDLLVLCAVISWSLYTVTLRKRPTLDPLSFLLATFVVGALAMLPFAGLEWLRGQEIVWRAGTIGALAYVAIFPSVVGYLLYNRAVDMIGAGRAGQTMTLLPLFGAFLATGLLGEPLYAYHYVGMVLIIGGILLSALRGAGPSSAIGAARERDPAR